MSLLELNNLCKTYDVPAVSHVSLRLESGGILSLLGPSGCGKTTLLRLVAGLEPPDQGRVLLDGKDITALSPHKRQIGMMFQEFALFPHKSVFENVAFGLHMQKISRPHIKRRTEKMLALVGLTEFSGRNVSDLSGGERQRVALARSLAPRPKLLLLDEPLGALDRALRERLLSEIHSILKALNMTSLFVTHDQTEALTVGDMVAVMNQGRIEQSDTAELLYLQPKNTFVAEFLGYKNLLTGTVNDIGGVQTEFGILQACTDELRPAQRVTVVIPSDGVRLYKGDSTQNPGQRIEGRITSRLFTGQTYRIEVAVDRHRSLVCDFPNKAIPPNTGERVSLWLDPQHMIVIPD